jgi:site-specific recombinase XerD
MKIKIKTNFPFSVSSIQYASDGELCITLTTDTASEDRQYEYAASLGSGQAVERPQISLAHYTLNFVACHRIKAVSKSPYRLMVKYLTGYGDRTLDAITTDYLQDFIGYMQAKGMAQNSVRLYFQKLTCVLHHASKEGLFDDRILQRVRRLPKPKEQKGYLTEKDINKLIRTRSHGKHGNIEAMFLFSCLTGLRFSDVKALRWKDVKHDGKRLRIEFLQHKTGTSESLPLSDGAEALLRGQARTGATVFEPVTNQWANGVLKKWMAAAGIKKPATFHTARHTFCVMLLTRGVPIFTVQKLMCHSDIGTTKVYADILSRTKAKAVRRLPFFDIHRQAI